MAAAMIWQYDEDWDGCIICALGRQTTKRKVMRERLIKKYR
jgi:hypothetical protein